MKNYYLSKDAGHLFTRNRYIENLISNMKNEIRTTDPDNLNFLFGKLDSFVEGKGKLHKSLVDEIIDLKKQIADCENNDILNELSYLKGYMKGTEEILNYDRQLFEKDSSFVLYVYSLSAELVLKYKLALEASDLFSERDEEDKVKYQISTDVDEVCESILGLDDDTECSICVIYDRENLPSKEIMQKLSFGRNSNVYLLHDNESIKHSVHNIVKKIIKTTIL